MEEENSEIPAPPDLSSLYQEQTEKLEDARKAVSKAFDVFKERDQKVGVLANSYQEEMIKVLAIAKAVTTPPTAIASVPVVLAAANTAFAQAPITEQAVIAAINASFAPLKK